MSVLFSTLFCTLLLGLVCGGVLFDLTQEEAQPMVLGFVDPKLQVKPQEGCWKALVSEEVLAWLEVEDEEGRRFQVGPMNEELLGVDRLLAPVVLCSTMWLGERAILLVSTKSVSSINLLVEDQQLVVEAMEVGMALHTAQLDKGLNHHKEGKLEGPFLSVLKIGSCKLSEMSGTARSRSSKRLRSFGGRQSMRTNGASSRFAVIPGNPTVVTMHMLLFFMTMMPACMNILYSPSTPANAQYKTILSTQAGRDVGSCSKVEQC
eukprot:SM000230S07334  [mRNA]  locus=s230:31045:34962:+ [translate_table: standard]